MYSYRFVISPFFPFLFMMLAGCANTYVQPPINQPYVTVEGYSDRNGLFEWKTARISSIDNQDVIDWSLVGGGSVRVTPGEHLFVADVQFNRSFLSGGPYEAFVDLRAFIQAGREYKLKANVEGSNVQVWFEDLLNRPVSNVASSNYQRTPQYTSTVIVVHS